MNSPIERRGHPRLSANARAVVTAPGMEMSCVILDASSGGIRIRTDRQLALPAQVVIIDIADATACEAQVVWRKGAEAGLKLRTQSSLRGLVPARLVPAREAWLRAGGR